MPFYVYMVHCSDDTLYTGFTTNPKKRIETHNSGKGARYTRSRRPVRLCYLEEFEEKSPALKREAAIKKLSRHQKMELVREYEKKGPKSLED